MTSSLPVSVIVPTGLGHGRCAECIGSVAAALRRVPGSELILVVDTTHAGRAVELPALDGVRVVESARPGAAAARNAGLERAANPVVLFTDDDCLVPGGWCVETVAGLERSGRTAAAGPVDVEERGPITSFLNYQRSFDAPPLTATTVRFPVTANCALDRRRPGGTAGFNERDFQRAAGEDIDLGYRLGRAGGGTAWLPDVAPVVHLLEEDPCQLIRRYLGYGKASARLAPERRRGHEEGADGLDLSDAVRWRRYGRILMAQLFQRRQFGELASPAADAFFLMELTREVCFLVGFLHESASLTGEARIAADLGELAVSLGEIVAERGPAIGGWSVASSPDIMVDMRRLGVSGDLRVLRRRQRLLDLVAKTVKRVAPLAGDDAIRERGTVGPACVTRGAAADRRLLDLLESGWALPSAPCDLARDLRPIGLEFRTGCRRLERGLIQLWSSATEVERSRRDAPYRNHLARR